MYDDDEQQRTEEWELEYQSHIENLYQKLRGWIINEKGDKVKLTEPLMKKHGVGCFMAYLQSFMHKGIALSNLDEKEIRGFALNTSKAFDSEMIEDYRKWGVSIKSMAMISQIFSINLYAVLSRAKAGREQHWRSKRLKIKVNSNHQDTKRSDDDFDI
jgi:hypothetical protein